MKALSKCEEGRAEGQDRHHVRARRRRRRTRSPRPTTKLRAGDRKELRRRRQGSAARPATTTRWRRSRGRRSVPTSRAWAAPTRSANCDDISDCLFCINEKAIDQAIDLYYGALNPSSPGSDLNKCQIAIGKATSAFFASKTKALGKCWDARYNGKHGNAASGCPATARRVAAIDEGRDQEDRHASTRPAAAAIDAAARRRSASPSSLSDRHHSRWLGLRRSDHEPRQPHRLRRCVTEFKVDCEVPLAVPGFQPYPAECVAVPPTPTPTADR